MVEEGARKMIQYTKRENMVTEKGLRCDNCEKLLAVKMFNADNSTWTTEKCDEDIESYFHVCTHHYEWGNDSCESGETFELCSRECLRAFLDKYVDATERKSEDERFEDAPSMRMEIDRCEISDF